MVTIKEVLKMKPFRSARVAAGKNGLDRQISSVTVAEVPDAANWLQGGELVCTTAYFIRQGVKYQIDWFESIIKGGASAVAIKPSRFLQSIPQPIVELADRYQIPLIEVSHEITWPTIIESVMQLLSAEQIKLIQSSADIHRRLTDLVLNNESIELIAQEIAELIEQPVIIEDVHLNPIAHARIDDQPIFKRRLGDQIKNQIITSHFYQDVLRGVVKEKNDMFLSEEPPLRNLIVPIISNQTVYGFISALYIKESYRLLDAIVLENGAVALSLQFMRQRVLEQTIQSKTSALIQDLIGGRINTNLIRDPQFLHIDWSKPLFVIVMETFLNTETQYDIWNRTNGTVQQVIQTELNGIFNHHLIGFQGNIITIIVSVPPKISSDAPALLHDAVAESIKKLEEIFDSNIFKTGISKVCHKLSNLSRSYKEAMEALAIAKSFQNLGSVVPFEQLGVHRLLALVTDTKELKAFSDDFLSSLKKYDLDHDEDLMKTLHVYLIQNGNINKAAKELFVHPNTVLYRMKKIHSILGRDLNSMDMRLTYFAALEAEQMFISK